MQKINNKEFKELLKKDNKESYLISDYEIQLDEDITINLFDTSYTFNNCSFKGERIDFHDNGESINAKHDNKFKSLSFRNCSIENNLFIKDCKLYWLEIQNVKISSKQFFITNSDIERITIAGSPDKYNLISSIYINELNNQEADLDFRLNEILDALTISDSNFKTSTINANLINRIYIHDSEFSKSMSFWKNKLKSYSSVENCIFSDIEAYASDFGNEMHFNKVKFIGNCNFEDSHNLNSRIKFTKCNFEKYVYFDKSTLYELLFDTTFFKEIVSFQNLECSSIKFNRTHIDKVAFFNDLKILNLNKCDLKTIRQIKNQLLKTENKIDYLKYYALEQSNLLSSPSLSLNDKLLLKLNKQSNDFGNSWITGVIFTLKKGATFFALVLLVNTFVVSKYPLSFNINQSIAPISQILSEFLKFVFLLGFDNKEIQSNGYLFLIFIVAKIFIGYGVYQTISAFRKYGRS